MALDTKGFGSGAPAGFELARLPLPAAAQQVAEAQNAVKRCEDALALARAQVKDRDEALGLMQRKLDRVRQVYAAAQICRPGTRVRVVGDHTQRGKCGTVLNPEQLREPWMRIRASHEVIAQLDGDPDPTYITVSKLEVA